jgi:hypothetical protein
MPQSLHHVYTPSWRRQVPARDRLPGLRLPAHIVSADNNFHCLFVARVALPNIERGPVRHKC